MLAVCALLFFAGLLACLVTGTRIAWALLGGLVIFWCYGRLKKFSRKELAGMAWKELKKALIVVVVVFLIGNITGLWRASGTITYAIIKGMELVTPRLFLVIAFLLSAALSYVLGTSFGVASTMGVILMAIARSGGVDIAITAGVVLSGIYFGDRCSPASSAASLVAAVTETKLYDNTRLMLRTGLIPTLLTIAVYTVLSLFHPITAVDEGVLAALRSAFAISWTALIPAVVMFVLPLCKVSIRITMLSSIAVSAVIAYVVQGFSVPEILSVAWGGYHPADPALASVLSGGGIVSMVDSYVIVSLTGMYSGILKGTGALDALEEKAAALALRIGRFPAMVAVTTLCASVLCNQAVTSMLGTQLMRGSYEDKRELAQDMENSGIMISGLIPWSIACSVPLAMLGSDLRSIPYAVLLWSTPLCYGLTKRYFFPGRK